MIDVQCDCHNNMILCGLASLAQQYGWNPAAPFIHLIGTIFGIKYDTIDKGYYSLYYLWPKSKTLTIDEMIDIIKKSPPL